MKGQALRPSGHVPPGWYFAVFGFALGSWKSTNREGGESKTKGMWKTIYGSMKEVEAKTEKRKGTERRS